MKPRNHIEVGKEPALTSFECGSITRLGMQADSGAHPYESFMARAPSQSFERLLYHCPTHDRGLSETTGTPEAIMLHNSEVHVHISMMHSNLTNATWAPGHENFDEFQPHSGKRRPLAW